MIILLTIAYYLQAHGAYAQLANSDQSDKSCCDLGHCRSIWDIVWSCVTTIFACTWLAVHLNVPEQGKGRLWKFGRRFYAFVVALIAPEIIIVKAWDQRANAKKIATKYKARKWTLTHGFFVNMGGFMIHDMNDGMDYVLDGDDIDAYLRSGQINITEEQIQDRSKGDILTKGLVVLQTTWFIIQLLARAIAHLPITELEFSTLAFAILNGASYALWWNKPLDVQCPIILVEHTLNGNIPAVRVVDGSIPSHSMGGDSTDDGMRDHLIDQLEKHNKEHGHLRVKSVRFLDNGVHNEPTKAVGYMLAAIGLLFGGIHCIAWVSHFPTAAEKLLWQITSMTTIILPLMIAIYEFVDNRVGFPETNDDIFYLIVLILYSIARLFLLVLAFTTLRSLPLDAYTTVQWTTFIPHI